MGEALLARLKDDAAVQTLAGNRLFWDVRPQAGSSSGLPAVVLSTTGGVRGKDLDGFDGTGEAVVQASCFALTKRESRALAEAVIAAAIPEEQVADVSFEFGSANEPVDLGEQTETGFIFHAATDLIIRWGRVPAP